MGLINKKAGLGIFIASVALIGVTVSAAAMANNGSLFAFGQFGNNASDYTVTLDSSNAYAGQNEQYITTSSGSWQISFAYTNASVLSNGHVTLASGGTLINTRDIVSIDYLKFHFDGNLQFRTSYDGNTWSEYATAQDNEIYNLPSNPYYVELKANGGSVNLYQAIYQYTCVANPNAQGSALEESWNRVSNASDLSDGDEIVIASTTTDDTNGGFYSLQNQALSETRWYWLQVQSITLSEDKATATVGDSNSKWVINNGSTTGKWKLSSGSSYLYASVSGSNYNIGITDTYDSSTCDWEFTFTDSAVTLKSGTVFIYLKAYNDVAAEFAGSSYAGTKTTSYVYKHKLPSKPNDVVGFTIEDTKANSYKVGDTYSSSNGLSVRAKYQDGTTVALASDEYTYKVSATQNGTAITSAFETAGTYYVTVSYKDFISQTIQIHVGEADAVLQTITVNSTKQTFKTSDKLSDYTSGITADLTYDKSASNVTGVSYSSFSDYDITCALLKNGVAYDNTAVFGTPSTDATWKIRITSNSDSTKYGELSITVEAVPVTDITIKQGDTTASEVSVYVGKTTQLTVNVSPNDATNSSVVWSVYSAEPEGCATVDQTGLVNGVAEGTAVIRATAQDGSEIFGACTVNVLANTEPDTWTLVTNDATLASGDKLVIASNQKGKTAGDISSSVMVENDSTFGESYNTITELNENAVKLTLGGTSGSWTLANDNDELLGATAVKKLAWDSGTTTWSISISGGDATIQNGTESYGRFLHNVSSTRFTTYTSATSTTMLMPQLYRGTTSTPVYPTSLSIAADETDLYIGGSTQFTPTFGGTGVNQKDVKWFSSNENVATIDTNGLLTIAAGASIGDTTVVTAKAKKSATDDWTLASSNEVTIKVVATPVEKINLSKTSVTLAVGGTSTLSVTSITPSTATNQNVTWSVEDANPVGCVSFADGTITANAVGSAKVRATSVSTPSVYAECSVSVTSDSGGGSSEGFENATMTPGTKAEAATVNGDEAVKVGTSNNSGDMTIAIPKGAIMVSFYAAAWNAKAGSINLTIGSGTISSETLDLTADSGISGNSPFTLNGNAEDYKFTLNLSNVTSDTTLTLSSGTATRFVVWGATVCTQLIEATDISLANIEVGIGNNKTLTPTYSPANANYGKAVTWSKVNGSSNISVDSTGKVSVTKSASVGESAIIQATLTAKNKTAQCTVSVVESQKDDWALLFYVSGSNLESDGGDATKDLKEVLSVRDQQPDSVKIVVQTGGSPTWSMSGVSGTEIGRYEIDSTCSASSMKKVSTLAQANMGDQSTFQSFLEWGVNNYPADRYGVIMWNHGGAMSGCCYDDNYDSYDEAPTGNVLTPKELSNAATNARANCGLTDKFEFIAYDACLMAVQDIAEWNSHDFNYMISSQETEWSDGYSYDKWLPTLYNNGNPGNADTVTVLSKVGDTFMDHMENDKGKYDQTQSVYDLSYMSSYLSAWESMTESLTSIINNQTKFNTFKSYIQQALTYGDGDYEVFDVKGAIEAMQTEDAYSSVSGKFETVLGLLGQVVVYNRYGTNSAVKGSCGMNLVAPITGKFEKEAGVYECTDGVTRYFAAVYESGSTNFTKWRTFMYKYGTFAD